MANPGGIKIDDDDGPNGYEESVQRILQQIACNPIGAMLLAMIDRNKHDMTVSPLTKSDIASLGNDNAVTLAVKPIDTHPEGVFYHLGQEDNPDTPEDERDLRSNVKGTGKGSDTEIHFTPGKFAGPGSNPDEILVHEMVHGLRMMQGLLDKWPTATDDSIRGYDNEEDFLAIMIDNTYISATGGTHLRANHHGYHRLKAPLDTSEGFLGDPPHMNLMQKYKSSWNTAFFQFAMVRGPKFHPIRLLVNMPSSVEAAVRGLFVPEVPDTCRK